MAEDTESNNSIVVNGSPPLIVETEKPGGDKTDKCVPENEIIRENGTDKGGPVSESVQEEITISSVAAEVRKLDSFISSESGEANEELRSLGDLDGLQAGSDSGVEGCGGRALSSGGGSRSCASSVVSCGSGCGSDSSSLAPLRPRRRVNLTEPQRPLGTSTPRPVTAPRGPNLATRERARSREKPTLPEKPRPLTPKPRIRPNADLPNIVRESPALRAKPTKTSTARCRTPVSPGEEKRWPASVGRTSTDHSATRVAADKYGTLPRRRRDVTDAESPKHESVSRRPTVTRSVSSRVTRTKVRIYAEKTCQTVLLGSDVESALGGILPNIERISEVSRCHRGVQASSRDDELSLAITRTRTAEDLAQSERERRLNAEALLEAEREASRAAHTELHNNSMRLLELVGAGANSGADGCLRALEDQLRASAELATQQQQEIERLREQLTVSQMETSEGRAHSRTLEARLVEVERDAAEMQDFLAAETSALSDSLRETEVELGKTKKELECRRKECRQLVRLCEQRRQENLALAARAKGNHALVGVARRLRALTQLLTHSGSGSELVSPDDGPGLAAILHRNRIPNDDRSRHSDDNSADLLDSETEPCLVMDPEFPEEGWSESGEVGEVGEVGDTGEAGEVGEPWSGSEVSGTEEASIRSLSAAIVLRHRAEDGGDDPDTQRDIDNSLSELMRALRLLAEDGDTRLVHNMRERLEMAEKGVTDMCTKRLAEDSGKHMMEQYRHPVETSKTQPDLEDDFGFEEEMVSWSEAERRDRYEALDAALTALGPRAVLGWPALANHRQALERMALLLATPPTTLA